MKPRDYREVTREQDCYGHLREIIEERGGSMEYERKGYPWPGAWVILLKGGRVVCQSLGNKNFRELDQFYVLRRRNPKTWDDYDDFLLRNGAKKFLAWFARESQRQKRVR